ncbi:MAG: hypothetical protein J3K34DRAFT_527152, partial [Monoraphidium minutum]
MGFAEEALPVEGEHHNINESVTSSRSGDATGSTLYFGNLHPCVTVPVLQDICSYFGPVEHVKIIKDKGTGMGAGYGFVKFTDRRCATAALQYLNNKVLFGQEMRANWAFQSHQREDTSGHWHVFVGDLGQDVTDAVLFQSFSQLPGCSDARVMWDHATGRSKGYGFVAMATKEEAQGAIDKMHGQVIGSRRVRCGWAQHKQDDTATLTDPDEIDQSDPANTNVYVGNIAPDWSEADINAHFASFGPVVEVKLHKKGGYGFVRYRDHRDAVRAICDTNTKVIHGRPVKCSWGKNATGQRNAAAAAAAAAGAGGFGAFGMAGAAPGGGAGMGFGLGVQAGMAGGGGGGGLAPMLLQAGMGGGVMGQAAQVAQMVAPGMLQGMHGGGMALAGQADGSSLMAGGYMTGHGQVLGAAGAMASAQQPIMFMGGHQPGGGAPAGRLGG